MAKKEKSMIKEVLDVVKTMVQYHYTWYLIYPIQRVKRNGLKPEIRHQTAKLLFIFYMMTHHVENENSNFKPLAKKKEKKDIFFWLFNL